MADWDGDEYQARFDALAETGKDVHGEATFVRAYAPKSVLDAGCGSGRVAIELARHGISVVGIDVNSSMLEAARQRAPEVEWIDDDLTVFALGRSFDVVVMAGNVPLFTPPGTQADLVQHAAAHVAPGGLLIAGFSNDWAGREYTVAEYDAHVAPTGLELVDRFPTWDRAEWSPTSPYAVSVHRRPLSGG